MPRCGRARLPRAVLCRNSNPPVTVRRSMDRGLVPTVGRPAHWPAPRALTAEQLHRLGFQPGMPLPVAMPDLEHPAGSQVAFVLSCPGKEEARCGHPTVGATGHNLAMLLKEL